jgi:NADH:ubiquinone oxidoreductase subunit D
MDDMINDFDVDEEAHFDELDRMELRMEKMEQDMDIMMNQ